MFDIIRENPGYALIAFIILVCVVGDIVMVAISKRKKK
jgi:hypothetical protein